MRIRLFGVPYTPLGVYVGGRRRRYRRGCSSPQRPGPLTGMPSRLWYPAYPPLALGWVAGLASAPRAIATGPWHVVLSVLSFVFIFGAIIYMIVSAWRWKLSQKHVPRPPSPPLPPSPFDWEPPDPDPLPGPRPVNRQLPIDRPYPFRPY
jgi:hypothetical protein